MQLSGGDTSVTTEWKELKPKSGPWRQQMDQEVLFFGVCWLFSTELKRDEFIVAATSLLEYGGAISVYCCLIASTLFLCLPSTPRKTPVHSSLGLPGGTSSKEPPTNAGDMRDVGSILGSGRSLQKEPTPVFLLGKSHGEKILVGYSP